jgi:hypothetical protein
VEARAERDRMGGLLRCGFGSPPRNPGDDIPAFEVRRTRPADQPENPSTPPIFTKLYPIT